MLPWLLPLVAANVAVMLPVFALARKRYGPQKTTPEPAVPSARLGSLQLNVTVTVPAWLDFAGALYVTLVMFKFGAVRSMLICTVLKFAQLTAGFLFGVK